VATAQHYLVAMQRQLARAESAVGELRDWLQDRELAGLVTNARFLQDALNMHALAAEHAGETQAVPQIAQIAREAAGVVEARRMSLARTAAQVQTVPLADPIWWNVARNVASFRATLAAANHDAHPSSPTTPRRSGRLAAGGGARAARRGCAGTAPGATPCGDSPGTPRRARL